MKVQTFTVTVVVTAKYGASTGEVDRIMSRYLDGFATDDTVLEAVVTNTEDTGEAEDWTEE